MQEKDIKKRGLQNENLPENSSVEKLRRSLYKRGQEVKERPRRVLLKNEEVKDAPLDWEHSDDEKRMQERIRQERKTKRKKVSMAATVWILFFTALLFFVGAMGFALYHFFGGNGAVSCNNIDIMMRAPSSSPSGKVVPFTVEVRNRNTVPLQNSYIIIEYGEGVRSAVDVNSLLPNKRERIGNFAIGETVRIPQEVILTGTEKTSRVISARLEYNIEGSSTLFQCEGFHTIVVGTSPVTFTVQGFEEASSGQVLTFTLKAISNSEETVRNVRVSAEYPFGFSFIDSDPKPHFEKNVWDIGDMAPQSEKIITFRGMIEAQGTEARVLRFALGEKDVNDESRIRIPFQNITHPLLISQPFLLLKGIVNGESQNTISINSGSTVSVLLEWENPLSYELYDVEIYADLPSGYIRKESVSVEKGRYNSSENKILWTPQTLENLAIVPSGAKGNVRFSFATTNPGDSVSSQNPILPLSFSVKARRVINQNTVAQELQNQSPKTLQFNTELTLNPYGLYQSGPFVNRGPRPPRAEQETTYTIVWEIENTTNPADSVIVSTTLPVFVKWLEEKNPSNADISYNSATRKVVWNVGSVSSHSGQTRTLPSVAFKVSLIPSITDIGSALPLTQKILVEGKDRFTQKNLKKEYSEITTVLQKEPHTVQNDGIVVK